MLKVPTGNTCAGIPSDVCCKGICLRDNVRHGIFP
jgi:hypothetical protein